MRLRYWPLIGVAAVVLMGADCSGHKDTDQVQARQQERITQEGNSQVGMPAITNFRERKMMKQILELRDQASFTTYTYLFSEVSGKLIPFCRSIGYPLPYATQFTSPQKDQYYTSGTSYHMSMPQADPNGLFSPPSADGTWVMCQDSKHPDKVMPVYSEPKLVGAPWRLTDEKFPGETQ